jgi:hypothetical protein
MLITASLITGRRLVDQNRRADAVSIGVEAFHPDRLGAPSVALPVQATTKLPALSRRHRVWSPLSVS